MILVQVWCGGKGDMGVVLDVSEPSLVRRCWLCLGCGVHRLCMRNSLLLYWCLLMLIGVCVNRYDGSREWEDRVLLVVNW